MGKFASRCLGVILSILLAPLKIFIHHLLWLLLGASLIAVSPLIGIGMTVYYLAKATKLPITSFLLGAPIGAALGALVGGGLTAGVVLMELIMFPADIIQHIGQGIKASLGSNGLSGGVGAWWVEYWNDDGLGLDYVDNYVENFFKRVGQLWNFLCCQSCKTTERVDVAKNPENLSDDTASETESFSDSSDEEVEPKHSNPLFKYSTPSNQTTAQQADLMLIRH